MGMGIPLAFLLIVNIFRSSSGFQMPHSPLVCEKRGENRNKRRAIRAALAKVPNNCSASSLEPGKYIRSTGRLDVIRKSVYSVLFLANNY
ncbi:hypothetical protein V8F06_011310 [Rhypophila decipiens]